MLNIINKMVLFIQLKEFGKKQSFQPNILSIFLNPFLFQRWNLFKFIKKNSSVMKGRLLDFGCGRKPYRSLFKNVSDYIGVDIEVSGHIHNESEIDIFYDGKTLPFENDSFDSLFCSEVVEHLFEPELILKELNRVLKIEGKAIFTFPFVWQEHETPFDFARYTSFGSKYIFEKNGFEIIEYEKNGNFIMTIWQLFINMIFNIFSSKNRYFNTIFTFFLISPLNIIGLVLYVLPSKKDLYMTNHFLVKKVKEI